MLPIRLDRPLLILVIIILLGMGWASYWNWVHVSDTMRHWADARQLLSRTTDLISEVTEAETGQRGYLLTGSSDYLAPYEKAAVAIPFMADQVIEASRNDQPVAAEARLLKGYVLQKLQELEQTVAIRREKGLDVALEVVRTNVGKKTMDSIRTLGKEMTDQETDLVEQRRTAAESLAFRTFLFNAAGFTVLLLVVVFLQRTVEHGITAREGLVRQLDDARQNLEITLMSIGDAVIASDERGRITRMNPPAEKITGWRFQEANGLPLDKIFRIVNEETGEPVESPVAKALRTGESEGLANHTVLIAKDGRRLPIDDSGAPIRDSRRAVVGAVLVFRDISSRREQEIQIDKWYRIFQNAGFGVAVLVNDGKTIGDSNPAFAHMHGYESGELNGKAFAELVDGTSSYEEARQRSEDHALYESLHRRKDGSVFHAITDMTVFRNGSGDPLFHAAYFADISDRKQAEMRLRHSEERFRAAAEAMGDVIWTSNSQGEMTGEQPGWAEFSGQNFAEYQGHGLVKAVHPDDKEIFESWEQSLKDPKKFAANIRFLRRDGQYRTMSTTAVPVFDDDGAVREWVGALTDITDRQLQEEEVRESHERFEGLATAFPQLVWSSKPEGNLEYVNTGWKTYTGTLGTEPSGERAFWDDLLFPDDAVTHMERWKEAMATGKMFESQARLRRASDGTYRWFICRAVPVLGRDRRIVRWLGACTDINDQMNYAADLKLINEALERSNADLEQFAYAASHDLQEPLRMISLYTQLLQEEYSGILDETARSYVDFAVSGAQRVERLLQDLMAYSRVSATPQVEQAAPAGVAVEAALANLEAAVRKSGALFHIGELPAVMAPPVHLVLLFQNLIGNAMKYSGDKVPEIWIDAGPADKFWRFSVKDNGIGIEPQYAKQIFGVFKRLHGSEYEGTGIGLAVCQRIVERTGGRIWLESALGCGSTFFFTLPRGV